MVTAHIMDGYKALLRERGYESPSVIFLVSLVPTPVLSNKLWKHAKINMTH